MIGTDTSPDRSDLEILDFEVSKKLQNIAKKYFLKKLQTFSWEVFESKYFVSDIVFGCDGTGGSPTSSILVIFERRNTKIIALR